MVECGYHPPNERRTVLLPDVSFESRARATKPHLVTYAPYMPDLAVEIISPSQTLARVQRKAQVYPLHGCVLVRLIDPLERYAEVWRLGPNRAPQSQRVDQDGELSGAKILPGFALALQDLLPR